MQAEKKYPRAFFWRRLHSLTGLWLVIFLIEHLLTNSQATLLIGEDGSGFIRAVNAIKNLPYLPAIEVGLLALPFAIHTVWGIRYLWTGKSNSWPTDGSAPSLTHYPRNHAYSWQRITSWILLAGLLFHVIHMRIFNYPTAVKRGADVEWLIPVGLDPGMATVAERLDVLLYDSKRLEEKKQETATVDKAITSLVTRGQGDAEKELLLQRQEQNSQWIAAATAKPISDKEAIAVAPDFGTAELLVVREIFKSPWMIALYIPFVLAAAFHGFNGLWTFLITWGVTVTERSQRLMRSATTALMLLIVFLGLAALGSYWINLRY